MHYSKGLTVSAVFSAVAGASALVVGCSSTTPSPVAPGPIDLQAAPTHARWVDFQGVRVPVADQGPRRIDGPVATGYDPSPAGAGLAAIESTIRMSIADDTQWAQVGQQLLTAGPGRDRWATARVQLSITGPVPAGAAPRVLGYTVIDYSPARADVAIYTRQIDGSLTRNTVREIRHEDTWLLDLPAPPDRPSVTAVTRTPADMVHLPVPTQGPTR
jgi:hypothetical protein